MKRQSDLKEHCGQTMIGVEYSWNSPGHYDGVSEWRCHKCGYRKGRWTGKELKGKDYEKRFGGKK